MPKLAESAMGLLTSLFRTYPKLGDDFDFVDSLFTAPGGPKLLKSLISGSRAFVSRFFPEIVEIGRGSLLVMGTLVTYAPPELTPSIVDLLSDLLERRDLDSVALVTHIVHRLDENIKPHTERLCHFLFGFGEVNYEVMLAFSALIQVAGPAFRPFSAPFLACANAGLEIPDLISATALAIADFCQFVGAEEAGECTESLFGILERSVDSAENAREVPDVLDALGTIVVAAHRSPPVARLWDLAVAFANTPIDPEARGDIVYATLLFRGVVRALTGVIRGANLLSLTTLAKDGKFRREVIAKVTWIFARIWEIQAFQVSTMDAILELIETLAVVLQSHVAMMLRKPAPQCLLQWAICRGSGRTKLIAGEVCATISRL
jgi:hypothetical protein